MQDFSVSAQVAEMFEETIRTYQKQRGFTTTSRKNAILYMLSDIEHVCMHHEWDVQDLLYDSQLLDRCPRNPDDELE